MPKIYGRIKNSKSGSALVGVLCVMCIFAAIALSMLFAAYQVLHHSQQIMTKEQCHVVAETFSQELDEEIVAVDDTTGIRSYIKTSMTDGDGGTWTYYEKEESGHAKSEVTKHIAADMGSTAEKKAGTLDIGLYWRKSGSSDSYENRILVVEVTSKLRGEQYQIMNEYRLMPDSGGADAIWKWYNIGSARPGGGAE